MNRKSSDNLSVAVLGLGIMGRAIAQNLEEDGLLMATWNRTACPDAPQYTPEIKEVLNKARFLFIVVTDGKAVSYVLNKPFLREDHIVVQCSTVMPQENIEFSHQVALTNATFVEALLGGSKVAVVSRKLPFYLGGDIKDVKCIEPVLSGLSSSIIHVGEVGKASVAKLAMNLNLAIQIEALCESYAYAISNGLDDEQYFEVLRNNTGWNYLAEYKEPKLRNRDYSPQFSVRNMLKDVKLALATDKTSRGLTLLKKTRDIYASGEEKGLGDEDMIALLKMIQPE
jgi:3-hydroxyisobutyrate dehydrogenase-like beta-hydroxyacid dehydrogenase